MKVDYIIVGLGLAGLAFVEELILAKKSFVVFEDNSQASSLVAGGVYNPVILKRYTPVWNAKEQLNIAIPFYKSLEKKLGKDFDYQFSARKVFKSIEDQNNWYIASDKPKLSEFMNSTIINEKVEGVHANFGFGEVYQTGRVDTDVLVSEYRDYLKKHNMIRLESFDYDEIEFSKDSVLYKDIQTEKIVFCEGFGMKKNPFFNYLPLNGTKGETITIKAPNLKINFLLKSTLFVLPLGKDLFKVGATFNWTDKTSHATEEGKSELIEKLEKVLSIPYKIVDHNAGIRPTVKDRRPLVGRHPKHNNLIVFNGLGTRGVMIAPLLAQQLYNYLEKGNPLSTEVDINRYEKTSPKCGEVL